MILIISLSNIPPHQPVWSVCRHILLRIHTMFIKRPWKGAYLFSPQFPRRRRRIMVSLEYLPYY